MDKLTVPASLQQMERVIDFVETSLLRNGCGPNALKELLVAVDELFSNIARYAYSGACGEAEITVKLRDRVASVCFTDSGTPYNPLEREEPDVTLSIEDRKSGGLGIYMVKRSMDSIYYEYRDGKNILTVLKSI